MVLFSALFFRSCFVYDLFRYFSSAPGMSLAVFLLLRFAQISVVKGRPIHESHTAGAKALSERQAISTLFSTVPNVQSTATTGALESVVCIERLFKHFKMLTRIRQSTPVSKRTAEHPLHHSTRARQLL
jgi:hypothetical protein